MNRGYNSLAFPRGGHLIRGRREGWTAERTMDPLRPLMSGGGLESHNELKEMKKKAAAFKAGRPAFSQANVQIRSFACMLIKAKHPGQPSLGGGGVIRFETISSFCPPRLLESSPQDVFPDCSLKAADSYDH